VFQLLLVRLQLKRSGSGTAGATAAAVELSADVQQQPLLSRLLKPHSLVQALKFRVCLCNVCMRSGGLVLLMLLRLWVQQAQLTQLQLPLSWLKP